jgi:2-iminobutanoate/2-iminopropanoate deaminase
MFRSLRLISSPITARTFATTTTPKFQVIASKNAPAAIGPYSQATRANGMIYISGSLGLDPKTGNFPSEKIEDQTKQSMDNIKAILSEANTDMNSIVKTTILLADMADFPTVNTIYASYFTSGIFPARATYSVKGLPKNARVEIEAIAVDNIKK